MRCSRALSNSTKFIGLWFSLYSSRIYTYMYTCTWRNEEPHTVSTCMLFTLVSSVQMYAYMYLIKESFCCLIVLNILIYPGLLWLEGSTIVSIQQRVSHCHLNGYNHMCTCTCTYILCEMYVCMYASIYTGYVYCSVPFQI